MKLVLATHNPKKREEMAAILESLGVEVVLQSDLGIDVDVEETGETFAENAALKAVAVMKASGLGAIADDSGLCVDALGGEPGVYTARYAGEPTDNAKNNAKLLYNLMGVPREKRTARFVSAVACVFPDGREFTVRGECEGIIGEELCGTNGFGYDPLFISEKGCFGVISDEEKDSISHRGRALKELVKKLKEEYLC